MLEQLQRLQAHIGVLKTRLHHLERENTSLTEAKALAETDHHAQIVQKNSIITQKQEEVDNLTEQLTQLQDQTLQFLAKLLAVSITLVATYHWMGYTLLNYANLSFDQISKMN